MDGWTLFQQPLHLVIHLQLVLWFPPVSFSLLFDLFHFQLEEFAQDETRIDESVTFTVPGDVLVSFQGRSVPLGLGTDCQLCPPQQPARGHRDISLRELHRPVRQMWSRRCSS